MERAAAIGAGRQKSSALPCLGCRDRRVGREPLEPIPQGRRAFGQSRMTLPVLCPARRSLFRSHAVEPLCPLRSRVKGACVPDGVSVADSFLKRVCSLAGAPRIFYGNYFGQIYARIGKRQGAFPKKREDSSRRNCLLLSSYGAVSRPGDQSKYQSLSCVPEDDAQLPKRG